MSTRKHGARRWPRKRHVWAPSRSADRALYLKPGWTRRPFLRGMADRVSTRDLATSIPNRRSEWDARMSQPRSTGARRRPPNPPVEIEVRIDGREARRPTFEAGRRNEADTAGWRAARTRVAACAIVGAPNAANHAGQPMVAEVEIVSPGADARTR